MPMAKVVGLGDPGANAQMFGCIRKQFSKRIILRISRSLCFCIGRLGGAVQGDGHECGQAQRGDHQHRQWHPHPQQPADHGRRQGGRAQQPGLERADAPARSRRQCGHQHGVGHSTIALKEATCMN